MSEDAAFTEFWDEHHQRVLAYAMRRTDDASAQDAVAETFLVAWRRRDEVPADPLPWLLGVARRVLANQRRSSHRQLALVDVLGEQTRHHLEPGADIDRPLLAALARLADGDREVPLLLAWDGLTAAQAARTLGVTAGAVWVRAHRARRRLREQLNRLEEGSS